MAQTASESTPAAQRLAESGHVKISLDESYAFCRRLAKRTAGNFYYSFLTLPGDQFRAMCALYGFARVCDDLGDDPSSTIEEKAASLRDWRSRLDRALAGDPSGHAVFPALADVVTRHAIPPEHLHAVIDGMESDLHFGGFETFAELQQYCYQVAGAVGLCCVRIWGCDEECAVQPAIDCGTAFQLTNILRDLGEDAAMGRVYLPREDLRRFKYTADDLVAHRRGGRFREMMAFQIERARTFYENAEALFDCLKPPGRSILAAMLGIYGGLLNEIERRDYDVFTRRVSLSRWRKLRIAWGCFVRHRLLGR